MSQVYSDYWKRKEMLKTQVPAFPVIKYYKDVGLSPIEQIYFDTLKSSQSVLDFGAGDLWFMKKMKAAGYQGLYETLDLGEGADYTYRNLDQIKRKYDTVVCLDVLEHMPLTEGLTLLQNLAGLLNKDGILILQTPNARCVRNPLCWDMTHLHCYNGPDLWAYLSGLNMEVKGYRVSFSTKNKSPLKALRDLISRILITKFLGLDYADNLGMLAKKC